MHDFTVFITSFNYGHYIDKAIESVMNQTVSEWNLYILDNCSTDSTEAVVSRYLSDPRIHFVKHPNNIGHTKNITHGFTQLPGKYISTLQADDWLEPNFIERALTAFDSYPSISLAAFGWMAYLECSDTYAYADTIPYPIDFKGLTLLSPHLTLGNFIPLHLIAFRRSEIEIVFREMITTPLRQQGEQYIIKRLEDRNGPSHFSAEVAGYWRRHDTQLTSVHAQNFITGIEDIVESLIYCQVKDKFSATSRFLSLVHFVSSSAQIQYRTAVDWLLSHNGKHFPEQYGIEISGNEVALECLVCALLMAHEVLPTTKFVSISQTPDWLKDIYRRLGLSPREVLARGNHVYGGYFLPQGIEQLVAIYFEQNIGLPLPSTDCSPAESFYDKWLKNREHLPEDMEVVARGGDMAVSKGICFHLLLRLCPGDESYLADTLDSLNSQCFPNWHLDIISTLSSPEGLENIPCIGWNTVRSDQEAKAVADLLVQQRNQTWITEIPAGAYLDPLCLWRIAQEIDTSFTAYGFFVDDDCVDSTGKRHSPRFKLGVNPSLLTASDLAGPLFVRQDIWKSINGTSLSNASPWYDMLLRMTEKYGWQKLVHITDILITYPSLFPSDADSCRDILSRHFAAISSSTDIIPVTPNSWRIRYPLPSPAPSVTIALLSQGQLELTKRCLNSILEKTSYPNYEIIIVITPEGPDPEMDTWIKKTESSGISVLTPTEKIKPHAERFHLAIHTAKGEFVFIVREEAVIIQSNCLEELLRTCMQPNIAAVGPRLINPGSGSIHSAGSVLGISGLIGTPYANVSTLSENGYLDYLQVARDVSLLSLDCILIHKASYLSIGDVPNADDDPNLKETSLCSSLRAQGKRLIYQPMATAVFEGRLDLGFELEPRPSTKNPSIDMQMATWSSLQRDIDALIDPFWNPSLTLDKQIPTIETAYQAQWQSLPANLPRLFARTLTNGQGIFRVTAAMRSLRKAGRISECIWPQEGIREPTIGELARLKPDVAIIQHYLSDNNLQALDAWKRSKAVPFIVYTLDDLLTNLPEHNQLKKYIPPNSKARLKFALERCDRVISSTEYLAEIYRPLHHDIRVIPNCLEQEIWLPLRSQKRKGLKPRIGWAGGTTHQGDLILLKEVIEQTRLEADWIFFGMCPDEIRPLLSEYHPLGSFAEYPARLAALNLDIAVAPLTNHPFNQGKSNLRLLEYGILGIPVVCTDIDPYRNSPACRVENTPSAWIEALRERIHDADAREAEGRELKQWVQKSYLLENNLDQWLAAHLP